MLRLLIADDHPLFRMGLKYALQDAGFDIVAEASDGLEALKEAERHQPDVYILDIKMPGLDGIEVCKELREKQSDQPNLADQPEPIIIMLTTFESEAIIQAAQDAGAHGFFSKETSPTKLASHIRKIHAEPKKQWLPAVNMPKFTNRQMDVLALVAAGYSNKEIASILGLSAETIKSYLSAIYDKLGVNDRMAAIRACTELGLFLRQAS